MHQAVCAVCDSFIHAIAFGNMHHKSTIKIDMAQMQYCFFEALSERGSVFHSTIDTDKMQTYRKPGVWYHSSVEIVGGFWDSYLLQPPKAEANTPSKNSTLLFSIAHAVFIIL